MKKKFMALMLSFTMVISITACGGTENNASNGKSASNQADAPTEDPASESASDGADGTSGSDSESASDDADGTSGENKLVENEANGLTIGLPAEFSAVDSGVEGMAAFTNTDKTAFVTVTGPFMDNNAAPDLLTEEMLTSMFQESGCSDIAIDNIGTVQQPDGATAVAAFATGSMDGDQKSNLVMQYYFMEDGSGYYIMNYMYPLDDTATDDIIADILASVTAK